jgi:cell division GTPase FtsZ
MRKILTAFVLVAAVAGCGAQDVSATRAQAEKEKKEEKEKSPLAELEKKVKEVVLVGVTAGMDRAELSGQVEKVSVALREGKFCEAAQGLGVFKFYASRFWFLGRFQNKKDERKLASLADKAARKIKQRADSLGVNCDAAK